MPHRELQSVYRLRLGRYAAFLQVPLQDGFHTRFHKLALRWPQMGPRWATDGSCVVEKVVQQRYRRREAMHSRSVMLERPEELVHVRAFAEIPHCCDRLLQVLVGDVHGALN